MTRRYKTHEELGLTFAEYGALLGTRAMLERKVLIHDVNVAFRNVGAKHVFNMSIACETNQSCGSVTCIGGTMGLIMGLGHHNADRYVGKANGGLRRLFFPPDVLKYAKIKPEWTIKAIDNFLTYGEPRWEKAIPRKDWNRVLDD